VGVTVEDWMALTRTHSLRSGVFLVVRGGVVFGLSCPKRGRCAVVTLSLGMVIWWYGEVAIARKMKAVKMTIVRAAIFCCFESRRLLNFRRFLLLLMLLELFFFKTTFVVVASMISNHF